MGYFGVPLFGGFWSLLTSSTKYWIWDGPTPEGHLPSDGSLSRNPPHLMVSVWIHFGPLKGTYLRVPFLEGLGRKKPKQRFL